MHKLPFARTPVGKIVATLFTFSVLALSPAIARPATRYAFLRVDAASDGRTTLQMGFSLKDSLSAPARERIEKAFGASLTEIRHADEDDDDSDDANADEGTLSKPTADPVHFFDAESQIVLARSAFIVDGTMNLTPLFAALRDAGVDTLSVTVEHPACAYNYVRPGIKSPYPNLGTFSKRSYYTDSVDLQRPSAEQSALRIAFGYQRDSLAKRFGALALLLLLPIVFAIRRRIRSAQPQMDDRASIRYGAMRTVNAASLFVPIAWYMSYRVSGAKDIVKFAMTGSNPVSFLSVDLTLLFAPPLLCIFLCTMILTPLLRIEETGKSRRDVLKQFSLLVLGKYLPWLLVLAGLDAVAKKEYGVLVGLLAVGQLLRLVSRSILSKDASKTIYPLMGNSLRAKILELAARSGVAPREIYVLAEDGNKTANAGASAKKNIVLNEFLIKRFTKREVDAVVGHEIGHLRLNHSRMLRIVFYGGIAFALIASRLMWAVVGVSAILFRPLIHLMPYLYSSDYSYYVIIAVVLVIRQFISRRFEYSADSFAVTITGDSEAMITALAKLARLNLLPMSWARFDEGLFTHPSTIRRIHAIARQSGIPDYRLDLLLNQVDTPEDRYSLTDTAAAPVSLPPFAYQGSSQTGPAPGFPPPPPMTAARAARRKKSGLKVLIPFKHAPWAAAASLLLFTPGTSTAIHLAKAGIPAYLLVIVAGLATVLVDCIRLKSKLLKSHAKSIKFYPTSPEEFPYLDTELLARRTAELETLGFRHALDYSLDSDPSKALQPFGRLFLHPVHKCFAELGQVTAANRALTPMGCSVFGYLQEEWSHSVGDRYPNAQIYLNCTPRKLVRWMTGASPSELLDEHLRRRNEMISWLGIGVRELSASDFLLRSGRNAIASREEFKKRSVLLYLLRLDLFERNPTSEWLGEFAKIQGGKSKGAMEYERA